MEYDVIVIGGGPAGIQAALYTLRAGLKTVIISKDGGALAQAEMIENYYGLEQPLRGQELIERGRKQAQDLGATVLEAEVTDVQWDENFTISLPEEEVKAKAVILTVGSPRKKVNVKNIDQFEGHGVSYCAICDAFFYRDKKVAVIGSGEYALHEARVLKNTSSEVTVFLNGEEPTAEFTDDFQVIPERVLLVEGTDRLESVVCEGGSRYEIDGLFVALGSAGAADFARKLGLATENGRLNVDMNMQTAVPGLFAAGDCVGGVLQISVAVGEGAKAGLAAVKYVKNK